MADALDEVSTEYGLLAEAVKHPADFSSVTYRLRANARWHDGKPVTVDDVIFSLESFKKHHPQYAAYYRHVTKAEQTGEREVTFTFDSPGNRELPQIVGQLYVLPKHWWEGTDANGNKRDIGATRLEPPLGCGPYRIKSFVAGRTRRLRARGRTIGARTSTSMSAATISTRSASNISATPPSRWKRSRATISTGAPRTPRSTGRRATISLPAPISACCWRNSRSAARASCRPSCSTCGATNSRDPRVRRAFNYAFDFDEMNKQIFFGQYTRIASYFEGTELASRGLPEGEELAILKTVQDKVPPEVFTTEYTNPVGGSPERVRNNLREGVRLLKDAGWEVRDRRLVNVKTKEPMTIEFLTESPSFERVLLFYKPSLERLGATVTVRTVDDAQYENRLRSWDFDCIIASWGQSLSPGNEQRGYWGSQSADQSGSRNYAGIKNPAVDALIERVIFAKNRAELVAATKALDRVLLWNNYVVPQWTYGKVRTARWDRFSHPKLMPRYGAAAFPTVWWWDKEKASRTGSRS